MFRKHRGVAEAEQISPMKSVAHRKISGLGLGAPRNLVGVKKMIVNEMGGV